MAKRFGLLGYPLSHSISPQIHKMLFEISGNSNLDYKLFELTDIEKVFDMADGFNITLPYKKDIIPYLFEADEKVLLYNACNTVYNKKGYNTDVYGFLGALKHNGITFKDKSVLITGAGGVSSMMATEAALGGANVSIYNRNFEKAEKLANEIKDKTGFKIQAVAFNEIDNNFDMILQGTPSGMYPKPLSAPLPLEKIYKIPFVFDTIYNPVSTIIANAINYAGGKGVNGLHMLVMQAAKAQEIFNGYKFSNDDIAFVVNKVKELLPKLNIDKNIILIGPPGSGKSTLAEGISKIFDLEMVDIDSYIENNEKKSISDIFKHYGEDYFRNLEEKAILELAKSKGKIISTGGGMVLNIEVMKKLHIDRNNLIISINPSYEILLNRLSGDKKRPLLQGDFEKKLSQLLSKRKPLYKSFSNIDYKINVESSVLENVIRVCDLIITQKNDI